MPQQIYERKPVIDAVLRAVQAQPAERGEETTHPAPVLLLSGTPGSGGTALLAELADRLDRQVPTARVDLAAAQDVLDVVLAVMQRLYESAPGAQHGEKIRFPRLNLIIKALSCSADQAGTVASFKSYMESDTAETARRVKDWVERAARLLLPAAQQQLAVMTASTASWLYERFSHHAEVAALDWFADNTDIAKARAEPGHEALRTLNAWQRSAEPGERRKVEKVLCGALLADLRADYHRTEGAPHARRRDFWHGKRRHRLLIMLDNVRSAEQFGRRLLEMITDSRARNQRDGLAADPAVVVAVLRGEPFDNSIPAHGLDDEAVDRYPGVGGSERYFVVRLADLTKSATESLTTGSVLPTRWANTDFVQAVTAGHPLGANLIGTLMDGRLSGRGALRELLDYRLDRDELAAFDSPELPETTLIDYLIGRLLNVEPGRESDDSLLEAMMVIAATPAIRPAAYGAVLTYATRISRPEGRNAEEHLARLGWVLPGSEPMALLHPFVRTLLCRRLAADDHLWGQVHAGYVGHYSASDDAALRHHHRLALVGADDRREFAAVVRFLDDRLRLSERPAAEWIGTLELVAGAPNRLPRTIGPGRLAATLAAAAAVPAVDEQGRGDPARDAGSGGHPAGGDPDDAKRRQTVGRLLAARWLCRDRLLDPGYELASTIATCYNDLAFLRPGDDDAFFEQERHWKNIREWSGA